MISFTDAIKQLHAKANPKKAAEMKNSIKIDRVYLGISNPELNNIYKGWRASTSTDDRIRLAADLWDSNIYEARIVAAK
ncbi:MAG: DNA alkylation repair protein, partial [Rhodobacterales bacterium]|nr:DNA alkylation repair protein [Rhodobacterales bacterium]